MATRSKGTKLVTKSVRFSPEEGALVAQVSQRERLPEGTLMRKLVLEGLARYRVEEAITDYQAGDVNLGQAARRAGVSVQRLMVELDCRGIELASREHFTTSIENLAHLFGGTRELHEVVAEIQAGVPVERPPSPLADK